jgi:SNF2 family DNA or RNA helicase
MAWAAVDLDPGGTGGPWLAVGCDRSEYHLCQQVPGMNFRKSDGIWRAPLTWAAWVSLVTVWGSQPLDVRDPLAAWASAQWDWVKMRYSLRSALDAGSAGFRAVLDGLDRETGKQMYPFQRGGVPWLAGSERVLLGDPQGNGKTPQLIRGIQAVRKDGCDGPWLVVAPASALYNWKRELAAWAPELSVRVIDGTALKRRRQIMDEGEADVYVIGWQTLRLHTRLARYPGREFTRCDDHGGSTGKTAAQCEVHEKELNGIRWAGVIADEAHRMKDAGSKQTRAVWHLAHGARCFWPATGTPLADSIADLWPVLHGIDPRAFPSKSRFLDLYAVKMMAWSHGTEYLGLRPENEKAFHASVQPYIRRIPKEIAREGMPERLPVMFRYPEMTPGQARVYRQLKKTMLGELDSADISAANTAVLFGRLCQVSVASLEVRDGEDSDGFTRQDVRMAMPSSKADDLLDFLDDNPGQLVVSVNSPQLLRLCAGKLDARKITSCSIQGGQSPVERDQAVQWFQSGDCRVILLSAGTGGEAITLTASDTLLFLQPNPSHQVTEQMIGRVDRIGQENPVRVVYSITPGTVEERLYQLSRDKHARAGQVTRDPDLLRWMVTGDAAVTAGSDDTQS